MQKSSLLILSIVILFSTNSLSFTNLENYNQQDSIKYLIQNASNDTIRGNLYLELVGSYSEERKNDSVLTVGDRAYVYLIEQYKKELQANLKYNYAHNLAQLLALISDANIALHNEEETVAKSEEAIVFFKEIGDISAVAKRKTNLAQYFFEIGQKDRSQQYFDEAITLYTSVNDKAGLCEVMMFIGDNEIKYGNLDVGISYLEKGVTLSKMSGAYETVIIIYNGLGIACQRQGRNEEAVAYIDKAFETANLINDKKGIAQSLGNKGMIYLYQEDFEAGIEFTERALAINKEENIQIGISYNTNNLGILYRQAGNYEKAIENYHLSYSLQRATGRVAESYMICTNLGKVYLLMGELDSAAFYLNKVMDFAYKNDHSMLKLGALNQFSKLQIERGDLNGALKSAQEGLAIANASGDLRSERNFEEALHNVYKKKNNWKLAFTHYENYVTLNDSVINLEAQRDEIRRDAAYELELTKTENRYQLLEKEKEIIVNEAEINDLNKSKIIKDRTIFGISIFALLILSLIILWVINYRQNQSLKELKLREKIQGFMEEISTLQSTIKTESLHRSPEKIDLLKTDINTCLNDPLSNRELDVLLELTKGKGNQEIADSLFVSINTVRAHLANIYEKLEVKNRLQAVNKVSNMRPAT